MPFEAVSLCIKRPIATSGHASIHLLRHISNNDLVVVKYLKEEFNSANEDNFNAAITISDNFRGPTLKYYNEILVVVGKNKKGEKVEEIRYQLSPKNKDKRYTIVTRHIDSDDLGRVVSVHRTIRRL